MQDPLVPKGQSGEQPKKEASRAWKKAKLGVLSAARVKTRIKALARDTKKMRSMANEEQRQRYIAKVIVIITVLGVFMAFTKTGLFHMSSVGRWDNGQPYKFSYALTLTMAVFVLKIALIFFKRLIKGKPSKYKQLPRQGETFCDYVMPWLLLMVFTTFEMLSGTLASLGLLYGAPASLFVVFKSSKAVFLAILSVVILRRKLNAAQWTSLLLITLALMVATIAEGKGGGKGEAELNVIGPALLLLSELCHGAMLVYQEIAVQNYWPDPVALLSASAVFGVVLTAVAMYKARDIMVELPDGALRPFCDPRDSLVMLTNSPALLAVMVLHLSTHVTSDLTHIMILKHISALARTLCDAFKLILMWLCGKGFWLLGIFPAVAEAWTPGVLGSWLMLPSILVIVYAMLMFKNAVFVPINIEYEDGHWVFHEQVKAKGSDEEEEEAEDVASLDEPFYLMAFRSKRRKLPSQQWRKAVVKVNALVA